MLSQYKNDNETQPEGVLFGVITDPDGIPVPYALIFDNEEAVGYSKADGSYAIRLSQGNHVITVRGTHVLSETFEVSSTNKVMRKDIIVRVARIVDGDFNAK